MSLEVICPGFGRTGTNSLQLALMELGFSPCHHMHEVNDLDKVACWQAVARGERRDWDNLFAGYRAQTDWPGARYWRELADHYPGARVVLTTRDPDRWFDSMAETIIPFIVDRGRYTDEVENGVAQLAEDVVNQQVFGGRIADRETATRILRRHVAEVEEALPPSRRLTFSVRDGWEPLCEFLGVPVPDTPFPRTNSSADFNSGVPPLRPPPA